MSSYRLFFLFLPLILLILYILIDGREAEVIEARKVVGTQPEAGAVEAVQSLDPPPQGTALHAEKIVRPDAFPEQCLRPAQNSFPHPFRLLTVAGAQQHGAAVGAVKATAEGAVDDAGFVHLQIQLSPTRLRSVRYRLKAL